MRRILILPFLVFFISCNSQESNVVTKLNVAEYELAITKDTVQLVDVRTPGEFQASHIAGATNIDFFDNEGFDTKFNALDKEKPLYIYCRSGNRSSKAAKKLEALGFTSIIDLSGGYLAWQKEH